MLDLGATAYINSEAMLVVLLELVERSKTDSLPNVDLVAQLKADVGKYGVERQKIMEENVRLISQIRSYSIEVAALKEQTAGITRLMEMLKAENAHLKAALKNVPLAQAAQTVQDDNRLKQSYGKLQKEFHALKAQNVESLASLKILEDENEELTEELDQLRDQIKNAVAPKASLPH